MGLQCTSQLPVKPNLNLLMQHLSSTFTYIEYKIVCGIEDGIGIQYVNIRSHLEGITIANILV